MKQITTRKLAPIFSCYGLGIMASIVSATAVGQSTLDDSMLEEVIVTAQKREQSLQDTPISISVLDNSAVEKLKISNLLDMAHAVPNLDIRQTTNGSSGARIFIRGVGVNDHVVTLDGAVGVYMDGIYMARNTGLAFDVTDLERIEVLRGPQGSLWGRNTTGGAINLITKKPSGEFGFKQSLDVGNYDYLRSNTQIDFPEVGGVSTKISLLHEEKDGWVSNQGAGVDFGDKDNQGLRLAVRWTPTDSLTVDYAYDYAQSEFGSAYYQNSSPATNPAFSSVPFSTDRLEKATPSTNYRASEYDMSSHSLTVAWNLSDDLTLKSITGYRDLEQRNYTDNGANAVSPRLFSNDPFNVDQDQISQEFQLLGNALDDALHYTLGLYYFQENGKEFNSDFITLAVPFLIELKAYDRDLEAENTAKAAFGEVSWTPGLFEDRLHLTAGLRYSVDEREIDLEQVAAFTGAFTAQAKDDWSNVSPSFVAAFDLSDDSNVYFKYTEGYRTGGFNGRGSSAREAETPVDEEKLVSLELGLKSEWFSRRLRFNAAVFKSDYEDIQLSLTDPAPDAPPGSILRINAGEAEIEGVELDLTAVIGEGLELKVSYAHLSSEFVEVIDPVTGLDISDSFVTVASPENSFNIDLEYRFPRTSLGEFSADLNYAWKDERAIEPRLTAAVEPLDSFGVWNGRLMLSDITVSSSGSLAVSLWAKNISDEEYQLDGFNLTTTSGSTLITYGEPRSYGLRFDYQY